MMKPLIGLGAVVVVAGLWYAFRPEKLFIDETVNESLSAEGKAFLSGTFHSGAHETKGMATIFNLPGGKRLLRLTGFETSNGPDVQVYLVKAGDATDNDTVKDAGFVNLGAMKGNVGDQNYEVPSDVDLGAHRAVTIWCRRFGVNFGTAPLRPANS